MDRLLVLDDTILVKHPLSPEEIVDYEPRLLDRVNGIAQVNRFGERYFLTVRGQLVPLSSAEWEMVKLLSGSASKSIPELSQREGSMDDWVAFCDKLSQLKCLVYARRHS